MAITIVTGPPAAGKSEYVQGVKSPADVVVDFDLIASALGSTESHDAPLGIRSVAWAARGAAIARIISGVDADAWIISTTLSDAEIATWSDRGAKFVLVDPGEDTALDRARRLRPADREEIVTDWYDNPPTFPPDATVTTVEQPAPRAAGALRSWRKGSGGAR